MLAVIDTGVLVSGVFWRHEPHRVLLAWKCGLLTPVVSPPIFGEYERVLEDVRRIEGFTTDLSPWLEALRIAAMWVSPSPLARKLCRDPSDDKFIEAALASGARTVIARDHDLTILKKPYGIEILTPRVWLSRLPRSQRRIVH